MKKYTEIKASSINSVLVRSDSILEEYVKAEVAERLFDACDSVGVHIKNDLDVMKDSDYVDFRISAGFLKQLRSAIRYAEDN